MSFAAHFDEIFASIFGSLPRPRLFKGPVGWTCVSPSVVCIGAATPGEAYARWKDGWLQAQALKSPNGHMTNKQEPTA